MKKKNSIWIYPLILMGFVLILTNSCKKDTNNNPLPTGPVPVLTTNAVSNIKDSSATCGGIITSDGGTTVSVRGVCWSTGTTPTISNSKTTDGTGAGSFTSAIIGLSPNTTYYVRAYATNSAGTGYGSAMSFTTVQVPVLTTSTVSGIKDSSVTCGGNVTSEGGSIVTVRGVCWSLGTTPTITDNKTSNGTGFGSFSSSITGLSPNTTYYIRAYATNNAGTGYGNILSFTTFIPIGHTYQGGILAYILHPGDLGYDANILHGLIAAPSDQSFSSSWYNAVSLCDNLVLNGYSDWYLPSKDELDKLYLNKVAIGGFSGYFYWSSTSYDASYAFFEDFSDGSIMCGGPGKSGTYHVRAIRSF